MPKNKPKYTYKIRQKRLSKVMYDFFNVLNNIHFISLLLGLIIIAFLITRKARYVVYARWFGFCLSCYGLISNDSIQTLGVFITANVHRTARWVLWSFITFIFFATIYTSWLYHHGDVTYDRLSVPEVTEVSFMQLMAPIALIFLTRLGLPVSTTFLLLSTFIQDNHIIQRVIIKSALGYMIAFIATFLVWSGILLLYKNQKRPRLHCGWFILQWITSGLLWSIWLRQDGANMAIFLPRQLALTDLICFVAFAALLLGIVFYKRGGNIQKVVNSKTGITDIRAATCVNGFYMMLLLIFTIYNKTPMSTTWLFIGLLGGRELASSLCLHWGKKEKKQRIRKSIYLIARDILYACIGLVFSIGLSLLVKFVDQ